MRGVLVECPECGAARLIPLTFPVYQRRAGPEVVYRRPVAKCAGCGERIYARVVARQPVLSETTTPTKTRTSAYAGCRGRAKGKYIPLSPEVTTWTGRLQGFGPALYSAPSRALAAMKGDAPLRGRSVAIES
jgi:hypothetical protein